MMADFARPDPGKHGETDNFDDIERWALDSIEKKETKRDREEENRDQKSTQTTLGGWAGDHTSATDKEKPSERTTTTPHTKKQKRIEKNEKGEASTKRGNDRHKEKRTEGEGKQGDQAGLQEELPTMLIAVPEDRIEKILRDGYICTKRHRVPAAKDEESAKKTYKTNRGNRENRRAPEIIKVITVPEDVKITRYKGGWQIGTKHLQPQHMIRNEPQETKQKKKEKGHNERLRNDQEWEEGRHEQERAGMKRKVEELGNIREDRLRGGSCGEILVEALRRTGGGNQGRQTNEQNTEEKAERIEEMKRRWGRYNLRKQERNQGGSSSSSSKEATNQEQEPIRLRPNEETMRKGRSHTRQVEGTARTKYGEEQQQTGGKRKRKGE